VEVDKHLGVFFAVLLGEADVELLWVGHHPVQVEHPVAYDRILIKQLVELAQLKEDDRIKILGLHLPVLGHGRTEILPISLWDVQR
jgi:hypothetical protein